MSREGCWFVDCETAARAVSSEVLFPQGLHSFRVCDQVKLAPVLLLFLLVVVYYDTGRGPAHFVVLQNTHAHAHTHLQVWGNICPGDDAPTGLITQLKLLLF